MKKRWTMLAIVALLLTMEGCKETTDQGEAARATLNGTGASSGTAGTTSAPPSSREPYLLQRSSATPSSPAPKETEMLQRMGIDVESGRIIIDTNRTRHYFKALERQLKAGMHAGMEKVKEHAASVDDIGIHVSKEKVEIDLNKTKHFLKIWGESMKILGKELDQSFKSSP